MVYDQLKFTKKMMEKYVSLYPDLDRDIICSIVEEVLVEYPNIYYHYDFIQEHPEFCSKCGGCCKPLGCSYFNGRTCDAYENRFVACRMVPLYDMDEDNFGLTLDPNCSFAVKCAEYILDEKIKEYAEL